MKTITTHQFGQHLIAFRVEKKLTNNLNSPVLPPKVLSPLQPLHVIEGSIVRMSCVIEGDRLGVRWFLNNEDITNKNKVCLKDMINR